MTNHRTDPLTGDLLESADMGRGQRKREAFNPEPIAEAHKLISEKSEAVGGIFEEIFGSRIIASSASSAASLRKQDKIRTRLRAKISEKKGRNGQVVKEVIAEAKEVLKKAAPVDNDPTTAANEIPTSPNPDKEALLAAVELARADPRNPALRPFCHGDHQRQTRALDKVLDGSPWLHPAVENSGMSCTDQKSNS